MNCPTAQERLLAIPNLGELPDGLRDHLGDCSHCQAYLNRLNQVNVALMDLPVPPSDRGVFTTFLQTIKAVEVVTPAEPRSRFNRAIPVRAWGALAASIAVVAALWWATPEQTRTNISTPHREHALLTSEVKHLAALTTANTPPERMRVWTDVATDLEGETNRIYKIADAEQMESLARMYDKAVRKGIVAQAQQLSPLMLPAERETLLNDAEQTLARMERDTSMMLQQAPMQSQSPLQRMVESAREGQTQLRGGNS